MGIELGSQNGLATRLAELERKVQWLSTRDVLQNASIGAGGLLVEDNGSIRIQGGGAAYVNGLKLSALSAAQISGWITGFAVGTSNATVLTSTVTVPAGYTTAILFVNGEIEFSNNNSGAIEAQGGLSISSSSGSISANAPAMDVPVAGLGTNTMVAVMTAVITGMSAAPGQTVSVYGTVVSGTAITASPYNAFGIAGIALFIA